MQSPFLTPRCAGGRGRGGARGAGPKGAGRAWGTGVPRSGYKRVCVSVLCVEGMKEADEGGLLSIGPMSH
jgi:hypothetical protein